MKFDYIEKNYIADPTSQTPVFVGLTVSWQVTKGAKETCRGQFVVEGQEFKDFVENKKTLEELTENKVKKLLEFDTRRLDEFDLKKYEEKSESQEKTLKELKEQNLELTLMLSNGGAL